MLREILMLAGFFCKICCEVFSKTVNGYKVSLTAAVNVLRGGAFFAAVVAVNILSKEEKERTAEYLFTHPVSRERVLIQELLAVVSQLILMNILVYLLSVGSIVIIGESVPWKDLTLLHVAYFFL